MVSAEVWDPALEYGEFQFSLWELVDAYEDKLLCIVYDYDEERNLKRFLAYYHLNGEGELLAEMPLDENYQLFASKNGNLYAYSDMPGNGLIVLDSELNVISEREPEGKIYGMYESPDIDDIF